MLRCLHFSIFDRFLILILHHTLSNRFTLSRSKSCSLTSYISFNTVYVSLSGRSHQNCVRCPKTNLLLYGDLFNLPAAYLIDLYIKMACTKITNETVDDL